MFADPNYNSSDNEDPRNDLYLDWVFFLLILKSKTKIKENSQSSILYQVIT
jgi:hypothetical protein